jgi:RNA polymerase sigma factor (sigma-70 family)
VTRAAAAAQLGQAAEAVVVALAMSGDGAAFAELVRRRQSWLRNLLRRLSREPALADDLAQQVLLQAWRSLPRLQSVAAFGAWLRRLAVNAWLSHLRSARAQVAADVTAGEAELVTPQNAERIDLDRALARLAPEERLCIVLAYSEGLSHGDISAMTQLPLGTVKSHVRRGAERLRHLLHAYQPAEDHAHAG